MQYPAPKMIERAFQMLALCLSASAVALADDAFASQVRSAAIPFVDAADLDPLIQRARGRRAVLLGESTHGTSEFYAWRKAVTRRLIAEHGFRFVAVEGDWEAWHAVRPYLDSDPGAPGSATEALRVFQRWPRWLWANEETAELVDWLRAFNADRPPSERVYIYGLDLYGASRAWRELLVRIDTHDPGAVPGFEQDYELFRRHDGDFAAYARTLAQGGPSAAAGAERAVDRLRAWLVEQPELDETEVLHLEQLALVVRNAERHFRAMIQPGPHSWNERADHFFLTFDNLSRRYGAGSRGVAWAHNTHIGDARTTPMAEHGHRNIGQRARQEYGSNATLLVGLTSARGRVVAAPAWGGVWRDKPLPRARPGSLEARLKETGIDQFLLLFDEDPAWSPFRRPIDQRGIGVVYEPEREEQAYYTPSAPAWRYDALLFFRQTEPLRLL